MKTTPSHHHKNARRAFTLIELLVVIAIIGILAGIFLPALAKARGRAKVAVARNEMRQIEAAIKQYESSYDRYPASKDTEGAGTPDFTFGFDSANGTLRNNSEVMEILLDVARAGGVNEGHRRNPKQSRMLDAKQNAGTGPGVSTFDYIFRDPWGKPYIITVDLNDDGKCLDAFYKKGTVSQKSGQVGHNGLSNTTDPGKDLFELRNSVMVWSYGPDGSVNDGLKANQGANLDNVLSWQ